MKVTLDATRIAHLLALIASSLVGAYLLVTLLEWTPMAAFGMACTLSTQLSNIVLWYRKEFFSQRAKASAANEAGDRKKRKSRLGHKKNKKT